MYEQYGMGQYPFPWGGVTPPPNWQPQTAPMQQNQQEIQGVRFVSGIEEAKNCTIPPGSKALLMDKEKDRFYLKETDMTGVSTVSEFEFKKIEAEAPQEYVTQLYSQMARIMTSHRSEHSEMPHELQEFYDWQRTKTMDCMAEVKVLVDSYK